MAALAQQATIKGTVINGKTKETLPGVNITVSATQGVTSDMQGNYVIKVDPGKIKVTYSFVGFTRVVRHHEVKAGDVSTDNVNMD